jgi:hypothetical protein
MYAIRLWTESAREIIELLLELGHHRFEQQRKQGWRRYEPVRDSRPPQAEHASRHHSLGCHPIVLFSERRNDAECALRLPKADDEMTRWPVNMSHPYQPFQYPICGDRFIALAKE